MQVVCLALAGLFLGGFVPAGEVERDPHSHACFDEVRVTHLDLAIDVDSDQQTLSGTATWNVERAPGLPAHVPLILDTRDLTIEEVSARTPEVAIFAPVAWTLGPSDPILGQPLRIALPADATQVRIRYRTAPTASALQWVDPQGTVGKARPFLYTQSQAIHARSWVPCQDTPGVRFTFTARVVPPPGLKALMAASGPETLPKGVSERFPERVGFAFAMTQKIPSYLLAMAVGDLEFRSIGARSGVWAERGVVEKAAWEFADTEKMLTAAEARFGPYRWERYDILVLPPSFPYGGMENPRLTFATPTVLAGDRSQVALIAHELAHSWAGNLVTNATWGDFWLNEGFTVYLERRIVEDVFGPARGAMEAVLGYQELQNDLANLPPRDQILNIDLRGRDPDDGVTRIPYEKGDLFLETMAARLGRDRVNAFLRRYFDHFAFQSISTHQFEEYLKAELFGGEPPAIDLHAWIHEPGLPGDAAQPSSDRFAEIEDLARRWLAGELPAGAIETDAWTTLEWLHFLRALPSPLKSEQMETLDRAFALTHSGNAEIVCQWLEMAIRAGYRGTDEKLRSFLGSVGRRKFLMPLYSSLCETEAGRERAREYFAANRAGYHPIAVESIRRLVESRPTP